MIKNVPYRNGDSSARHYIDKEQLDAIVRECIANDRTASDELARNWYKIINNMIQSHNFNFYPHAIQQDMKSFACYKLVRSMDSIDMEKCESSFGYFTRIVYLAFITVLAKNNKYLKKNREIADILNSILKDRC